MNSDDLDSFDSNEDYWVSRMEVNDRHHRKISHQDMVEENPLLLDRLEKMRDEKVRDRMIAEIDKREQKKIKEEQKIKKKERRLKKEEFTPQKLRDETINKEKQKIKKE